MGNSGFVVSLLVLFTFSLLRSVCGDTELTALLEVKASLDPENKLLKSWTVNGDPCGGSFEGIGCNEQRRVANLSLQGKGLSGKLSPALSGLKSLSALYLHYNNLSGEIPKEIANLTQLTDLYLDVNNLSGSIPPEIGHMTGLQVLQLCCNQLTGNLPTRMGSLKGLSVLTLQHNKLTGEIPTSLGNLEMLSRLDLSFNSFFGPIPESLALNPHLEVLNVQNNSLYGIVPPGKFVSTFPAQRLENFDLDLSLLIIGNEGLKRLNGGFQCQNNPGLCGVGFASLRNCTPFDNAQINQPEPFRSHLNKTVTIDIPDSTNYPAQCNQRHCSKSSKLRKVLIVVGVVTITITLAVAGFFTLFRYRRQKQKIGSTAESSEDQLSTDLAKELNGNGTGASPLLSLEYIHGWDPSGHGLNGSGIYQEQLNNFRFNLEEIESATQCFSEVNLLGRSNFSCVYKGILREGSVVAIRSISVTSCKSDEAEFVKGLNLLNSIRHENVARLRGFCCSRGRGECFLIYDFIPKGKLSKYLDVDVETGNANILDWPTRVSIILGIAKGIAYIHGSEGSKPAIVHRNISVEKILLDQQFNPLIADCGLHKLLADDVVFSALKTSAAMGYLAPEYVTTGQFTEKSDVFAFGVIVLQILSGKLVLSSSMRVASESGTFENFIDKNLDGNFAESEAALLGKIAIACAQELPENRPTMVEVVEELTIGAAAPVMASFLFPLLMHQGDETR